MFAWMTKYRNNIKSQIRVRYKRAVFLFWLEVSFGLIMVMFLVILVKIFIG
jgi:hypothetical protein